MSEAKPTPGPHEAFTERQFSGWWAIRSVESGLEIGSGDGGFDEPDARLYADAGTVYHQTGLTPSQLVERVKELEDCLDRMQKGMRRQIDLIAERAPGDFLNKRSVVQKLTMHEARARAALAKSTSIGDTQCKTTN